MESLMRRIDRVCGILTTILMMSLACALFLQVILRNFFHLGPAWLEESARLFHVALVFLALPLLEREKLQVKVDFIVDLFPAPVGRAFRFLALIATLTFVGFFLYGGWRLIKKTGDMTMPGTGLPNMVLLAPIMVGMLLMALAAVSAFLNQLGTIKNGGSK